MKKTQRLLIITIGSVFAIFGALLIYLYRYRLSAFINEHLYGQYIMEELTIEEKLDDFDSFYATITTSVPFLDEVEELYGVDFTERKDYYIEKIQETENNFEFYCTMMAICKDVPSFHTAVCFPDYWDLKGLSCYHSIETMSQIGMKAKIDAWTKIMEKSIYEYRDVNLLDVSYVDGKYVVNKLLLPEMFEDLQGNELVEIDGISADRYIVENISIYDLYYDSLHNKAYRYCYTFNDSVGKRVKVLWRDREGNEKEEWLFLDYGAEVVSAYGYRFLEELAQYEVSIPAITMYRDDVNQLEYVAVNNFINQDGKKLKKYLKDSPYNTVIIDLRYNYGGLISYPQDYLYPVLYQGDVKQNLNWIVPATEANEAMTKIWSVRLDFKHNKEGDYYHYSDVNTFRGAAKQDKNVYYLVGCETGSAADMYISMIKENHLGTVIGCNTGGEGLASSFICDSLDNSSLVYVYYPSVAIDSKTGEKIYGGTEPDYYINTTLEDFELRQEYRKDRTAFEYENRLKYDTELKWVIENLIQ